MIKHILVLDINDTLLTKFKSFSYCEISKLSKEKKEEIHQIDNCSLLKRQHTDFFIKYLNEHKLDYVFWSTALKKNIRKMIPYLEMSGYTFYIGYFGQEECEEGILTDKIKTKMNKKNLNVVSKFFNVNIDQCILIDNDENKRVGNQNFIKVDDACPFQEDQGLLKLCKEIDHFICCKENCSVKLYKYI